MNQNEIIEKLKQIPLFAGICENDEFMNEISRICTIRKFKKDEEIIKYDILLTENFEKLSNHLYKGKLNPKELYSDWDLNPKEIALSNLLKKGIKEKKIASTFNALKPNEIVNKSQKKSVLEINKLPNISFQKIEILFHKRLEFDP